MVEKGRVLRLLPALQADVTNLDDTRLLLDTVTKITFGRMEAVAGEAKARHHTMWKIEKYHAASLLTGAPAGIPARRVLLASHPDWSNLVHVRRSRASIIEQRVETIGMENMALAAFLGRCSCPI